MMTRLEKDLYGGKIVISSYVLTRMRTNCERNRSTIILMKIGLNYCLYALYSSRETNSMEQSTKDSAICMKCGGDIL